VVKHFALICAITGVTSCATAPTLPLVSTAAPNPNGCFAFVFERPGFNGSRYVLDGPLRVAPLATVVSPNGDWDRRIRSARLGDTAAVTVYADPNLSGRSGRFGRGATVSQNEGGLTGRMQSLKLDCEIQ